MTGHWRREQFVARSRGLDHQAEFLSAEDRVAFGRIGLCLSNCLGQGFAQQRRQRRADQLRSIQIGGKPFEESR